MTRPMPGPPDTHHVFYSFPHTHPDDALGACPKCCVDSRGGRESVAKRLTDAECAAEYWRARWETEANHYDRPILAPANEWADWEAMTRRAATWERLAARPHVFKETHNDHP